jgi:hypothetical protein
MSVLINADTSDGLVLTSDTSGEIKLQSAGADIATVDSTGIAMAAGKTLPAASLTGTLPAIDGSSLTNLPAPAALSTASGSAPSYSARAWVKFNGTGTPAIGGSANVSSITDNGTGDYTVNFTTAMADVNYAAHIAITAANHYACSTGGNNSNFTYATSSFRPGKCISQGGVVYDPTQVNVTVFR